MSIPGIPNSWYRGIGKRVIDVASAGLILAAVWPVLLTVAACLRLALGRGVLLRQERVGRHGAAFDMLKFRTMEASRRTDPILDANYGGPERRCTHKSDDDPRHTGLGRLIRRFSLDELPQLWNVFRGDMSLIGPRPELTVRATPEFVAHARHAVRPGLTGLYQISPLRRSGDLRAGLELDATYVASVSFASDVRIAVATVGALVRGTGS